MRNMRWLMMVALLVLWIAPAAVAQREPLRVVATYSVLGDLVANVAGENIELTVLVGADSDPHVYEPTPQDILALANADLLIENGLQLEPWIDNLYEVSGSSAVRVAASDGIEVLEFTGHGGHDHHDHEVGHVGHMEGEPTTGSRLAVADFENSTVRVVDLRDNSVVGEFSLAASARLYPSHNGRYAFAVQANANITNVIDSGVSLVPHDDHFDVDFGAPALLPFSISGRTPIHFVTHHEQIAIFNDGEGTASIFTQDDLFSRASRVVTISTARPHHGVAVPLDDVVLITAPNMSDMNSTLPIGVDVVSMAGELLQSFHECPGLHGEASYSDDGMAFGCSDGVLLIERDGEMFVSRKVENPTANPDLRTGTLYYAEGAQYLIGNYGQNTLVRVDPVAGTSEVILEAPARVWRFSYHGEDPSKLVALTIDGNLHVVDIATGAVEGSVQVVDPFLAPARGRSAPRPVFVVNGHMAYVSEPLPGDVRAVDLETLEISAERIFVGGKPASMAVFGAVPVTALEGDHDHAEHDHEHGEFDPHTWLSPRNAIIMVGNIRDALIAADADNAETYTANADAYIAQLQALDAEVTAAVAAIPEARRILITTHAVFAYFARDYGFSTPASALGAATTEAADPAAGEIAALIEEIRALGVPAIFVESVGNPRLMTQIAQEAGIVLAPTLYTHGLGPEGSGAETFIDMIRYNVGIIVEALR
jgi:ABC-type Zn uptake system ZnuABC Zn-binding protein ZnuA